MLYFGLFRGGARGLRESGFIVLGEVFDRCGTRTVAQPTWLKRSGSSLFKIFYVKVGLGQGCAVVKLG